MWDVDAVPLERRNEAGNKHLIKQQKWIRLAKQFNLYKGVNSNYKI